MGTYKAPLKWVFPKCIVFFKSWKYYLLETLACILVWQLSNKAADKTDPFIRRRVPPAPFSCRDKTVRTQQMQEAAYSQGSQQNAKLWDTSNFGAIETIPADIPQTSSGHLTIHIHEPQYKVVKSFAQIWPNSWVRGCGPSTLWALGQVKIIWSCEAGSLSFLRFQN